MTTATLSTPAAAADPWRLGAASAVLMKMIGFEPTGEMQAAILRCRKKSKLVVGGEQAGKSIESIADFIIHLYEDMVKFPGEPLLYWLVAADYPRTRAEFGYMVDFLTKLGHPVDASKRVDPGYIEVQYPNERKPRIRIETKSGKDPRTLAMFAPHGIIGCEASQLDLETYHKCIARLTPKNGWLHLAGTYEGQLGWYPGLAAAWSHGTETEQSFILDATTNKHLYPLGDEDPKIQELKRKTSDDFFLERIKGIAAPPKGLVFHEFRPDIHIRPVVYNPDLPIYINHDPGYGHASAIELFQVVMGGQIRVFDEIYERGLITEDLIAVCMQREWWKNPAKKLTIDPNYANQHHGTLSIADIWLSRAGLPSYGTKIKVAEGTERLKSYLKVDPLTGKPGIIFDPKCKGVLSELGAYPNPFDQQTRVYRYKTDSEGNVIPGDPEDRYNDGCKAIIYGIVEKFGLVTTEDSGHFVMRQHGPARPRSPQRVTSR